MKKIPEATTYLKPLEFRGLRCSGIDQPSARVPLVHKLGDQHLHLLAADGRLVLQHAVGEQGEGLGHGLEIEISDNTEVTRITKSSPRTFFSITKTEPFHTIKPNLTHTVSQTKLHHYNQSPNYK